VTRQWRGATYQIEVTNPRGVEKGVKAIYLNGKPTTNPIPQQPEGSDNEISVEMG
jgi:N,N'-diacetylchitobiose phosphorylase